MCYNAPELFTTNLIVMYPKKITATFLVISLSLFSHNSIFAAQDPSVVQSIGFFQTTDPYLPFSNDLKKQKWNIWYLLGSIFWKVWETGYSEGKKWKIKPDYLDYSGISAWNQIDSDVVMYSTGNVGIGTTSPAYKLDVTWDIRATWTIYWTVSYAGNAWAVWWVWIGSLHRNDVWWDYQLSSSTNWNTSYTYSTLELRESNYAWAWATPPRLWFHWGWIVASQVWIESSWRIAILNNPGTWYENLVAKEIQATSWFKFPDGTVQTTAAAWGGLVKNIYTVWNICNWANPCYVWWWSIFALNKVCELLWAKLFASDLSTTYITSTTTYGWWSYWVPYGSQTYRIWSISCWN